jgi:hypothetical protein
MDKLKALMVATSLATLGMCATQSHALVYSPYNAAGSPGTSIVQSVTGGYTASYWIADDQPESPANSSGNVIEAFSESITGLGLTGATADKNCPGSSREGLGGISGTNDACIGNVFTVKFNDDSYAIFVFAAALGLGDFDISLFTTSGGGLSHMDVYNSTPSPVPVPPAALLLATGVLGIGAMKRRSRKAVV